MDPQYMQALTRPATIRQIRLDLTTRCDLRCVYCAVSQKSYQGQDMPKVIRERAVALVGRIGTYHGLEPVDINGHGETTFADGWVETCRHLLLRDIPLRLTTNLAREYTQEEIEVLACMRSVAISIDTCDRALLRRLRRKVDVRQIVMNIQLIRASALRLYRKSPRFSFLTGLYDKNALLVEDLARFAVALGVYKMGFWSLTHYPYDHTDVGLEDQVFPLDDLADTDLLPRVQAILSAIRLLRENRLEVDVHADFIRVLARRVGLDA